MEIVFCCIQIQEMETKVLYNLKKKKHYNNLLNDKHIQYKKTWFNKNNL